MKKIISILLFVLASPIVLAQDIGRQGFYGQIASGYEWNTIQSTGVTTNVNSSTIFSAGSDERFHGVPLVFGFGYMTPIYKDFKLGLGIDYSAITQSQKMCPKNGGACNTFYVQNRINIFVSPSYQIDLNKMAYIKAGYSMQKISEDRVSSPTQTGYNISGNQSGYILGLGYKQIIYKGLYGFIEGNYMKYDSLTMTSSHESIPAGTTYYSSQNPKAFVYTTLVGVGYQF